MSAKHKINNRNENYLFHLHISHALLASALISQNNDQRSAKKSSNKLETNDCFVEIRKKKKVKKVEGPFVY